jgi:hypothetical protein
MDLPSLRTLEFKSVSMGEERIPTRNIHHLTSLTLENHPPSPSRLCTPHLIHLTIEFTADFFNFQENKRDIIKELGRFLGSCPLLEHMEIRCFGYTPATFKFAGIVSLPNLRSFTHVVPTSEYNPWLLNELSLPHSCSVVLRGSLWMDHDDCYVPEGGSVIPTLRDPSYFTNVKRIKLSAAEIFTDSLTLFFGIDLISNKGNRITLEKFMHVPPEDYGAGVDVNMMDLGTLRYIDMSSAEILCFHGYELRPGGRRGKLAVKNAWEHSKRLTALILSNSTTSSFLSALSPDPKGSYCPKIRTLVIHSHTRMSFDSEDVLETLLSVATERKMAGFPFNSVNVFIRYPEECEPDLLEALRGCIERFELVMGDDALDWDPDKYFLGGLENLRCG